MIQEKFAIEMVAQLEREATTLELRAYRLRAQARGLESQADEIDKQISGLLTAKNALELLVKEQAQRDKDEAKASQENK